MRKTRITELPIVTIKDVIWVDGLPRIERTIGGFSRVIEGDNVDLLLKEANDFFRSIILSEKENK